MIERLVIFGGTGDLSARYLLPGLAALHAHGYLSANFQLICASRQDWDDTRFRNWAASAFDQHGTDWPADSRAAITKAASFRHADVTDPEDVAALIAGGQPVAAYLALPPVLFPAAVRTVHHAGLPPGSMLVLEKPFGECLDDAVALNRLLAGVVSEQEVYRVDHFLAMTTVQNVLGSRLANRMLEPIWNSAHIAEIDIIWEETLTLENRAGYYDGVGALKDMVQNHLLQLLCLVAMEPPVSLGERDLRNHKVDVLRSVRPLTATGTRRARYTAGRIADREIPAYVDENGVDPAHHTETFAELTLELDSWRWAGTRFRLRSGKALGRERKEVTVRFRQVPHLAPGHTGTTEPNLLRFGLEPEDLTLQINTTTGRPHDLAPVALSTGLQAPELPAYALLLLNVLNGNTALSIRGDEAEQAWHILTPVLQAWEANQVPLEAYPAGSTGP